MAAPDESHPTGSVTGAGLAQVQRLCADLARSEENELMRSGSLREDPCRSLAGAAESAVAIAIEAGATLDDVHRAVLSEAGILARRRAAGRLACDAATLSFVEDNLMVRSEGEMPVGHVSRLRQVLTAARREFDDSVRRALVGGMSAEEIIAVAADAGIELATLDLVLAFSVAGAA
ncbi:MAG: hypothetical protein IT200_07810 [Thermoleophilia bacterium]|nr:hypothetical protein [Thermoleophilia bacterium]